MANIPKPKSISNTNLGAKAFEESLLNTFGSVNLAKIQNIKIGIGGAGGLGSNVANCLVRCGFQKFVIADKDLVEYSNLNRQFFFLHQVGLPKVLALKENLQLINPHVSVDTVLGEITSENVLDTFGACDIFVEAFDKVASKTLFVETLLPLNRLLIAVSGLAGWGNSDEIRIVKHSRTFYMVGDFKTSVNEKTPAISPRVSIAAAKEADIILCYILGDG